MKKQVFSVAIAVAATLASPLAVAEHFAEGPSCRSWLENPDLAKQQLVLGYLLGQADARLTLERSAKISLFDITEQEVFESVDRACKKMRGFPLAIAMQDTVYEMFALGSKRQQAYDEKRAKQR